MFKLLSQAWHKNMEPKGKERLPEFPEKLSNDEQWDRRSHEALPIRTQGNTGRWWKMEAHGKCIERPWDAMGMIWNGNGMGMAVQVDQVVQKLETAALWLGFRTAPRRFAAHHVAAGHAKRVTEDAGLLGDVALARSCWIPPQLCQIHNALSPGTLRHSLSSDAFF